MSMPLSFSAENRVEPVDLLVFYFDVRRQVELHLTDHVAAAAASLPSCFAASSPGIVQWAWQPHVTNLAEVEGKIGFC